MPKVASQIAAPLAKSKKITMISDGKGIVGPQRSESMLKIEILSFQKLVNFSELLLRS